MTQFPKEKALFRIRTRVIDFIFRKKEIAPKRRMKVTDFAFRKKNCVWKRSQSYWLYVSKEKSDSQERTTVISRTFRNNVI